jgi:uncharacterized protein (DUF2164 family)
VTIDLSAEAKQQAVVSIRRYFAAQFDEDIGDLKAGLLLDYFLKEIGPSIHNAAIARAQAYVADRLADLEGTCTVPEFDYWKTRGKG